MRLRRTLPPLTQQPLQVLRRERLHLDCRRQTARLDGVCHPANIGCWMYYLPALKAKLFHAADGKIDCIHPSRPEAGALLHPERPAGRYLVEDWRRALAMPAHRRLAEIWLVCARLWTAGLGPQPLGVCFVGEVVRDGVARGPTCGLLVENVFRMRRKLKCHAGHVISSGVIPDRILSCIRRQKRGYVIDWCSVVGCVPENAQKSVAALAGILHPPGQVPDHELLRVLASTLPGDIG